MRSYRHEPELAFRERAALERLTAAVARSGNDGYLIDLWLRGRSRHTRRA